MDGTTSSGPTIQAARTHPETPISSASGIAHPGSVFASPPSSWIAVKMRPNDKMNETSASGIARRKRSPIIDRCTEKAITAKRPPMIVENPAKKIGKDPFDMNRSAVPFTPQWVATWSGNRS